MTALEIGLCILGGGLLLLLGLVIWLLVRMHRPQETPTEILLLQQQMASGVQLMTQLNQQVAEGLNNTQNSLQNVQSTLGQRLDNAARVVGEVQKSLGTLGQANERIFEVGRDIASLQEILRSPKLRGGLGELFLGDLLAQILPPEHFSLQYKFRSGEMVDAVVKLNSGMVPVDAKFPLENFRRLVEADTDAGKAAARREFNRDVRKHIDAIAQKYLKPDEGTFDFALMYIPAENVYYETIIRGETKEGERSLFQDAMDRRVIPVSPNSFYAYLQTILLGLRGLQVEKSAKRILEQLSRLSGDLKQYEESLRLVGTHLGNAVKCHGSAEKQLEKISTRIEGFEELSG